MPNRWTVRLNDDSTKALRSPPNPFGALRRVGSAFRAKRSGKRKIRSFRGKIGREKRRTPRKKSAERRASHVSPEMAHGPTRPRLAGVSAGIA
eukprot:scaffold279_cov229-Pinguiococcus_pyrenoidosus.AAC.8